MSILEPIIVSPMPMPPSKTCLNCDTPYVAGATYCTTCGQSVHASRLSAIEVVKDALSNMFNLDNRIWHTVRDIYHPSKLAKAYVSGRRKYYISPARLFLVSLLLLITALLGDADLEDTNDTANSIKEDVLLAKQKMIFDSLSLSLDTEVDRVAIRAIADSLYGDIHIDSMWIGQENNLSIFDIDIAELRILKADVIALSGEELVDKYEITSFKDRLVVKQYIKMVTDTDSGIRYAFKNLTWVLFALVFVMALVLKLLYIRNGYYYVEHLVLLLYWHSPFFLAGASIFLVDTYVDNDTLLGEGLTVLGIVVLLSSYLTLKNYYQQGWFKTLMKLLLVLINYFLSALFLTVIGGIVSMIIF